MKSSIREKLSRAFDNDADDRGGKKDNDADDKIIKQTPVADDGAQPGRFGKSMHPAAKNLGKFLHPKKSVPAGEANGTVDANTGGAKVRATQ